VPGKDGKTADKKFADCTFGDMTRAIQAVKAPDKSLAPADAAKVSKAQQGLDKALGAHTAAHCKAHPTSAHVHVDLTSIPLEKLEEAMQAVLDAVRA